MRVVETALTEVIVMEPKVFDDPRGFLFESFNQGAFEALAGIKRSWVQDNFSRSTRGVIRGLHFQVDPAQGKIVRCTRGTIYDVVVDVRRSSPTFAAWFGTELSQKNLRSVWIPEGFAHGFAVLSDSADVQYKATAYYRSGGGKAVRWDDPQIGVAWPIDGPPILSPSDAAAPLLADADVYD